MTFQTTPLLHKRDAYKGPRFLKHAVFLSPDRFAIPN